MSLPGDLWNGERPARHTFNGKPAFRKNQVIGIDFKKVSGQIAGLFPDLLRCLIDGDTADRGCPAAERADAFGNDGRVPVDHLNLVNVNFQLICDDLSERGFLALTVW